MNNFKIQYLVGECKMDFPVATRIPSCENSFWIYLPDSIITVHVKHRQPAQVIFSHYNPDKNTDNKLQLSGFFHRFSGGEGKTERER
jgi:hypothetical protein